MVKSTLGIALGLILAGIVTAPQATTFLPISLKDQLKSSYAVVQGRYIASAYKKLPDGDIVTELSFSLSGAAGLSHAEIVNKQNFKVISPGGKWGDREVRVHGVPTFEEGEEVLLVLDKGKYGFRPASLGLSKYTIEREDGVRVAKSFIFPHHPKLGSVPWVEVEELIENRFGTSLHEIGSDKKVVVNSNSNREGANRGRVPASVDEHNPADERIGIFWLILLLAILGASSTVWVGKRR
jgi:hypothetical protein